MPKPTSSSTSPASSKRPRARKSAPSAKSTLFPKIAKEHFLALTGKLTSLKPWWFYGLIGLLAILPLPFGANRAWASDLFALWAGFLAIGAAQALLAVPETYPKGAPTKALTLACALFAAALLWSYLQTRNWVPATWHHPIWTLTQDLPGAFAGAISMDPDSFREALAKLLGYGLVFLVAFLAARDDTRAEKLMRAFAYITAAYALYGLLMQSLGSEKILWFDKWAYWGSVTSTFVNKNSFATYASLGLEAWLLLFWKNAQTHITYDPRKKSKWEARLEKIGRSDVYYFLGALLLLIALMLSASRAGIACGFIGCLTLGTALATNLGWRKTKMASILALTIALLGSLYAFGNMVVVERLADLPEDAQMRLSGYEIALHAIEDRPLLGHGLGAFSKAFQYHRTPTFVFWFDHAHDDYLETLVELGLPAGLMLFTAIGIPAFLCLQGARKRRRKIIYPIFGLAATVTITLHSFVDFGLQIPAVAGTYAAILGLGVAQSWSSREGLEKMEKAEAAPPIV